MSLFLVGFILSLTVQQVKADRGEIESDDKTFEAMQNKTKNLPNRQGPVNKTQ